MNEKELKRAKNIAYRLLKYRIRSEKELSRRLKLKKIPQNIITKVVKDLRNISLVNDEEFTKLWIRSRIRKGYGPLRIRSELRAKGIPEELIKDFLDKYANKQSSSILVEELIKRRVQRYRGKPTQEIRRKLFYYLGSRGFSFEDIQKALDNLDL